MTSTRHAVRRRPAGRPPERPRILEPETRAELTDRLAAAGLPRVEAVSFVNPARVPQMAGAEEVVAALHRRPGTVYAGLVLNDKGYDRLVATGLDEMHFAFASTETFNQRNQGAAVAESIATAATTRRTLARRRSPVDRHDRRLVRLPVRRSRRSRPDHGDRRASSPRRRRTRSSSPTRSASAPRPGCGHSSRPPWASAPRSACTSTTPATRATRTRSPRSKPGRACSTRRSAGSGAARSHPARPGTSRPKTSSTCSTARASRPESISTPSSRSRSGWKRVLGRPLEGQVYRAGTFAPVAG